MLGMHGLYESIDFSPARIAPGATSAIVRSYMAHHQGMILLSLVNYLHDQVMVRRFHADPLVRSVELLLQEKVPHNASLESSQPDDARSAEREPVHRQIVALPWTVPAQSPAPQVHFLSNGRYGALITRAGAGYSSWQEIDLTRWRSDTTCEDYGTWIYVQDMETGDLWSAGDQPTGAAPESQEVQFYPHMAEFRRGDHGIGLTMEITVAPDEDVEIRRISLTNHTDRLRRIKLTSYGEIILAPQTADVRASGVQQNVRGERVRPGSQHAALSAASPLGGRSATLSGAYSGRLAGSCRHRRLRNRPCAVPGSWWIIPCTGRAESA